MKQSYFTSPGFTFRLQPFGTTTALFLLFFLLNFSSGFGQDCTINSSAPDPTDESPIPLDLNFEGPINRDLVEDDFIVPNGEIGNFERLIPEFIKGANDIVIERFNVEGGLLDYFDLENFLRREFEDAVISITQYTEDDIFYLTYGNGVKSLNLISENSQETSINGDDLGSPLDIEASLPGSIQRLYLADKNEQQVNIYNNSATAKLDDFKVPNYDSSNDVGPTGIVTDAAGNIYVAVAFTPDGNYDVEYDKVAVYEAGNYNNPIVFPPDNSGIELDRPYRIAVDKIGRVYVADSGGSTPNGRVLVFDENYNHIHTIEGSLDNIGAPGSIVADDYGYIYIIDYQNDITFNGIFQNPEDLIAEYDKITSTSYSINVYDSNANFAYVTEFNQGLNLPIDLEVDYCGNILVNNLKMTGDQPGFSGIDVDFDFQLKTFTRHDNFTAEVTPEEEGEVVVTLNSDNDFFPCDPQPECTFSIDYETEAAPNESPVAVADNYSIQENETLVVNAADGVLENDSDPEDDALTAVLVDDVQNGTLDFESDGSFTYTPNPGFTDDDDTFTYYATDGEDNSNEVTVVIRVTSAPNEAPVAVPDNYSIQENEILVVNATNGVLENDSDPEDDALTAVLVDDVQNGTLDFEKDGSFTYTPNTDFSDEDTFTYYATDGEDNSNEVTVVITVTSAPNQAPVAVADNYSTQENETLVVNAADGVLENDSDPEDDALTAVLVDDVQNGTLDFESDGSFTYTPNPGFTDDDDTFTYYATDGEDNSNEVTVVIRVTSAPNEAPVAVPDNYSIQENEILVVNATNGVLENDSDPEDDALTAVLVDDVQNGTLNFENDGSFTYTPNTDFSDEDTFTYYATDGEENSDPATVTITVNEVVPVNRIPNALAESYTINQGEVLNISAPGVLENDSDPDGDNLTADLRRPAANGDFNFASNGSFTYEPDPGFTGVDDFIYVAYDGEDFSGEVRVTITVNQVNSAPIAEDDTYEVDQDEILNIPAPGVLGNDEDEDEDNLNANLEEGAQNGTVTLNSDGSFEYEPEDAFSGQDSFTYRANDGELDSNIATVTITVNAPDPNAPEIECVTHELFLDQDGQVTLNPEDILDGERGNLELSVDIENFDCSNLGENTVILTATDPDTGLSDTCVTEVMISDDILPVANCVAPGREFRLQNGSVTISPSAIDLNSEDNCEITRTLSEDTFTIPGTKNIILYVEDAAGNTDQCTTTIEILPEDTDRVYRCIEEAEIPNITLDEDCELNIPSYTFFVQAQNFNPAMTQTYEKLTEDTYLITVEIREFGSAEFVGECEFLVNVVDLIPPGISCPNDQIESFDPDTGFEVPNYENMAGISDNCGEVSFRQEPAAGEIIYNNTTVNLFVEDEGGLEASCSFELELTEADVLNISCLIDKNVNPDDNCSFWLPDYTSNADVNFPGADITQTPPVGTILTESTQIKLTASLNGETDECYFMVNLVDDQDPVANCVSGYVVNLNNNGTASITPEDLGNNSTDNCGIVSMALSQVDFTTADIGDVPVTLTVRDDAGNIDSCETTVEVRGEASGEFECRENIEVFLDENGEANLNIQELYTGNASGLNLEASRLNFTCEDLGAAFIQLDYSGDETGSCTINVDVRDELPPEINTNLVELTLDIEGFAYLEESDISAEDSCSEELIYRFSKTVFTCKDVGMNSVNVEVEDINGNRSDKNIQVRISGEGCDLPEPGENEYLFLYPNPNNGIFTIATPEGMFIEQVRVFDSRGRYIMQQDYNANARFYRMTIQGVEESVYTLQIFTNEGVIVKRAIIKR